MRYPAKVTIIEVGPRDGLQNESAFVSTKDKIAFINLLSQTGLKDIEVTSFVSPKAIPQLADNELVYQSIEKPMGIQFSALVPNEEGMQKAMQAKVHKIAVFTAASDTFNQRNIHCSIEESIARFMPVIALAKLQGITVRGYISCALGCPYEGSVAPAKVVAVTKMLQQLGVEEFSFGDTIGVGTPKQTLALLEEILKITPLSTLAMHFHNTYGQAIANIYAALTVGVYQFDSAVAGLGGCPYAKGASGNVATEDLLYLLHGLGIDTGVDIYKIVSAGAMICKALGKENQSMVAKALLGSS